MNRTINIALKIGFVCVSFVMGAMIILCLLFVLSFGVSDILLGRFVMIVTTLMIGLSYAFRDTFHWFNLRHRLFWGFIQFLLFQLILSFLYAIGLGWSVYSAYWRMMYREGQGWPILDPHLDAFIQFSVVLLSMVAIMTAARMIFQALYRVPLDFIKSIVLFTAIIFLMLQITIIGAFGYTSTSCISSITCHGKSSFSPDGTREIRWIEIMDNTNNQRALDGGVSGDIFMIKDAHSPVWKAIKGHKGESDSWGDGKPLYAEFIWSKDSSRVYNLWVYEKGVSLMRIGFGYDFQSDREIPPETACNNYRELPDLILPNLTCPQKPER